MFTVPKGKKEVVVRGKTSDYKEEEVSQFPPALMINGEIIGFDPSNVFVPNARQFVYFGEDTYVPYSTLSLQELHDHFKKILIKFEDRLDESSCISSNAEEKAQAIFTQIEWSLTIYKKAKAQLQNARDGNDSRLSTSEVQKLGELKFAGIPDDVLRQSKLDILTTSEMKKWNNNCTHFSSVSKIPFNMLSVDSKEKFCQMVEAGTKLQIWSQIKDLIDLYEQYNQEKKNVLSEANCFITDLKGLVELEQENMKDTTVFHTYEYFSCVVSKLTEEIKEKKPRLAKRLSSAIEQANESKGDTLSRYQLLVDDLYKVLSETMDNIQDILEGNETEHSFHHYSQVLDLLIYLQSSSNPIRQPIFTESWVDKYVEDARTSYSNIPVEIELGEEQKEIAIISPKKYTLSLMESTFKHSEPKHGSESDDKNEQYETSTISCSIQ